MSPRELTQPRRRPSPSRRSRALPAHSEDWQELPALQRTLHALSPVAPLDAFTTGLAAHQNPSFLAPLGHRVDPDGPGGLVNGLASVRPGHSIPYAAATALAVPTPSKPRQTVQRHSITWSTPAAATPADASAVAQDNAALVEENPSSSPVPATGDPADTDVSDRVSPTAPARRTAATALPSPLPGATAESHSGSTDDVVQTTVPASAGVDTEVVTPEPAPTTSTEGQVVPLLGAPDVVSSAAPLTAGPEPGSAEPPRASTPLPVSRLAEGTGTVQPTGRPVTAAQPPASEGGQAGASPPTISSAATPVPILQRRLAAVPERGPRTGVLPPPFTVELPVVASPVVEPPAAAGSPSDGLLGGASSDTEPAPTVGLTAPVPNTAPSSSQQPTPDSGQPVLDLPTAPTAGPEPAATGEPQAPDLPIARLASSPEPVLTADPEPAAVRPEPETAGSEPAELTAPLSGFAARIASLTSPPAEAPPADAPPTVAPGPLAPPIIQRLAGPAPSHDGPADSPEPPVVPTVSMSAPLVQRSTDQTADVEAGPAPAASPLPIASSGPVEAGGSHGFDQPLPVAPVVTSPTADHGEGLGSATGESVPATGSAIGGPISAPSTALPVVSRLTSDEPYSPASPAPTPRMSTETAALVPHRPPLAVRSDLSSAVAPPPPVQRLSFPDPGDETPGPRSDAPAAVQRMPATPGAAVLTDSPRARSPTRARCVRCSTNVRWAQVWFRPAVPRVKWTRSRCSAGQPANWPCPQRTRRQSWPPVAPASTHPQRRRPLARRSRSRRCSPAPRGRPPRSPRTIPATPPSSCRPPQSRPAIHHQRTNRPLVRQRSGRWRPPPRRRRLPPLPPARPAHPAAGAAAAELDEMARRLYEPLSARLRAELWLDRERAGLVTDAPSLTAREGGSRCPRGTRDPAVSVCFAVTIDDDELGLRSTAARASGSRW